MKPKYTRIPICDLTIYFCPNCKTGHQVSRDMNKCEICGVDLNWEGVDEEVAKIIKKEKMSK